MSQAMVQMIVAARDLRHIDQLAYSGLLCSGQTVEEAGENPARSRHCDRLAGTTGTSR